MTNNLLVGKSEVDTLLIFLASLALALPSEK
jgi:hypothetical protein